MVLVGDAEKRMITRRYSSDGLANKKSKVSSLADFTSFKRI
jgi:hypothetical protein